MHKWMEKKLLHGKHVNHYLLFSQIFFSEAILISILRCFYDRNEEKLIWCHDFESAKGKHGIGWENERWLWMKQFETISGGNDTGSFISNEKK